MARLLVIVVLLSGSAGICPAQTPEGGGDEATIESFREAIAGSHNDADKAALYKKLGDLYVSREDFKNAAEEYIRALSLKGDFAESEWVQMTVAISWGDRLEEAIAEFRSIVNKNPDNNEARTHLARTLSWAGRFDESLGEINTVLGRDPENKDALLVKANDLRWKGEIDEALPLYRSILEKKEDFDARIGYTYVLFAQGEVAAARESLALLKPAYPYQEDELKKLQEEINKPKPAQQSRGAVKFSHYQDTDGNVVNRYLVSYAFPVRGGNPLFNYLHTEAHDDTRRNSTDMVSGETRIPAGRRLGMGAGLGIIRYHDGGEPDFLVGHLNTDLEMPHGSAGIALAREPLNETAELIEKRIRRSAAGVSLDHTMTERLSLSGNYTYADYSDANSSNDLQLALRYALAQETPRLTIGYRFRYLDFGHQSFDGYFDPNRFTSYQLLLNTSFEQGQVSGSAELFVGHQSFMRYGAGNNDFIYGGTASIGYKLTKNITVEVNVEGGDYALQTATGFRYHLYGVRLSGAW
jgi:thioredoxin-like negative regulator of GroEL